MDGTHLYGSCIVVCKGRSSVIRSYVIYVVSISNFERPHIKGEGENRRWYTVIDRIIGQKPVAHNSFVRIQPSFRRHFWP